MRYRQKLLMPILILLAGFTTANAQQNQALTYYRLINQAELAICRKELSTAGKYYQQAFAINPHKVAYNDRLNAFHCAMDTKRSTEAATYFKAMRAEGMTPQELAELLTIYPADSVKIREWTARYPQVATRQTFLADTIAAMYERDQGIRRYFLARHADGRYMNDSVRAVDQANAAQLYHLVQTYGLHACLNSTGEAREQCITILLHHMQSCDKSRRPLFDTILYNGIFSFEVTPSLFEIMINAAMDAYADHHFRYKDLVLKLPVQVVFGAYGFGKEQEIWPRYLPEKEERAINKERLKTGLPSLSDVREKTIFSKMAAKKNSSDMKYALTVASLYTDAQDEKERDLMKKAYLKYRLHKKKVAYAR